MPDWVVLKFGGTSVSTRARWDTIARIVQQRLDEGVRPFVVCSAVSTISRMLNRLVSDAIAGDYQTTLEAIRERHRALGDELGVDADALLGATFDELGRLALGLSLTREAGPPLRARILATGELMSTTLGAAFLSAQGIGTEWLDARTMLEATREPTALAERRYLSATCDAHPDAALQARLAEVEADVCLTQGFIARLHTGETVLLGWGGSDTSAAYFAAKLEAARLEIWTDVPGMFTANPKLIPSARLLKRLGYDEAQELATAGAEVLHARSIDPVRRLGIPLHILSTDAPELEHTVIAADVPDFGPQVKSVTATSGLTLIAMDTLGMWQQVGFLADVFNVFRRHNLSIDLVATSQTNVTVSLDLPNGEPLDAETIQAVLEDLEPFCQARAFGPCAAVTLVGRHLRAILSELGPVMEAFEEQQIFLISQAASDLNFTFVVREDDVERLLRKLHAQLFTSRPTDGLFGPTWRELFGDEAAAVGQGAWWRRRRDDLLALAADQSPVYVYDQATLHAQVERLQAVDAVDRLFYAIKANSNPDVLRVFHERGLGFECVSPGELARVRDLFPDLPADRLLFTPNFAPRDEYAAAFEMGAYVTLDNLYPLEAWPEVFEGQDVIVRLDPGQGLGHHRHVRTAGHRSKFGIVPEELDRLQQLATSASVRVVGLHAHVGSGIADAQTWAETAVFLAGVAERFPDVRLLNLGGGLGVPEAPGSQALDLEALAATLRTFKAANPGFVLWLEPGRFLVAEAGVLLARVTQLKGKGAVRYVGLETGMNSLLRPALYGSYHEIVNLTRLDAPLTTTAEVVGPICESGDVLGHGRRLPATEEGDVLLVATAGAYGHAMASTYNLRLPAAEALLRADAAEGRA